MQKLDPNKWIDKYSDYLFKYTLARVSDYELSKDIVQDTFFSALKSAKNFEGKATKEPGWYQFLKER